ncbi:MAG TPA: hypothetical protein VL172_16065, partial [Kofleriaceae bacterium]|nr:hypothetical protein [Kofleriaceae bacterium]
RTLAQVRDGLAHLVAVVAHTTGILALCARGRTGPGTDAGDADPAAALLAALRSGPLAPREWLALATELTRPFAGQPDAHPLPELVAHLHPPGRPAPALASVIEQLAEATALAGDDGDERLRQRLARAQARLGRVLRGMPFLFEYAWVVPRGGVAERWTGARREPRPGLELVGDPPPDGAPALVGGDGRVALALATLVQALPPTPGMAAELLLFDGCDRRGPRLVSHPAGFEVHDDAIAGWLRDQLGDAATGDAGADQAQRAPYRGLASFGADDADLFYGREREVEAFVNRLRMQPLIAVVGPSGVGKTSFVQAGVVPALPSGWRAVTMRPGPSPRAALTSALARAAGGPGPCVLIVDQFEEVFTLGADAGERRAFAEALAGAATAAEAPLRVIITLRDDFLVRAEQLAPLRSRLARGLQLLTTPATDDLLRILIEPARRLGFEFEDAALPLEMVSAVAEQPGALAMLSFTASRLWERRDRHLRQLSRRVYQAMGGVAGALAGHAEDTLRALGDEDQPRAREAFRHLVTSEGTRAVLHRDEIVQLLGGGQPAENVVEELLRSRLLVSSEGPDGGDRIEVIHETLLVAWPRLVDWRREDAEGIRLRDQLRAAARQWQERGRPGGLLWRDEALAEYRLWRARYPGALTDSEKAFGAASVRAAERSQRRRRLILGTAFAVLALGLAGMYLLRQQSVRHAAAARASAAEARASAAEARDRLVKGYIEQGRQAVVDNRNAEALAYLTQVRLMGVDSPAIDLMIGLAARPLQAQQLALVQPGKIIVGDLSADGARVLTGAD